MKKFVIFLCLSLLLTAPFAARADQYTLHTPGPDSITAAQAVERAKAYLLTLCPALEETRLKDARTESPDYLFGPGWQWDADTQEDCWVLPLPSALAVVHGATGEVLYYSYWLEPREGWSMLYNNCQPSSMSVDEAVEIAARRVAAVTGEEEDTLLEGEISGGFFLAAVPDDPDAAPVPAWEVIFHLRDIPGDWARCVGGCVICEETGNVLWDIPGMEPV